MHLPNPYSRCFCTFLYNIIIIIIIGGNIITNASPERHPKSLVVAVVFGIIITLNSIISPGVRIGTNRGSIKASCPMRGAMIAAPGAIACLGALSAIREIRKQHFGFGTNLNSGSASVWLQWTKSSAALQVAEIRECWRFRLLRR